jgi:hypothetical protein
LSFAAEFQDLLRKTKGVINKKAPYYFESRYREEKKNTSRQDLLLPKNACPGN